MKLPFNLIFLMYFLRLERWKRQMSYASFPTVPVRCCLCLPHSIQLCTYSSSVCVDDIKQGQKVVLKWNDFLCNKQQGDCLLWQVPFVVTHISYFYLGFMQWAFTNTHPKYGLCWGINGCESNLVNAPLCDEIFNLLKITLTRLYLCACLYVGSDWSNADGHKVLLWTSGRNKKVE